MNPTTYFDRVPKDPKVIIGALVVTFLLALMIGYFLFRCSKFSRSKYENQDELTK